MTWPAGFQALCLAVLAAAYALYLRSVPRSERRAVLVEVGLVALGAWLAEETSILRYGVYAYPGWWWLKLDQVPLLVVAIWPVVVQSSRLVVSALFPAARGLSRAVLVGAMVAVDASLVEVIAVRSELWGWTFGGYLGVPVIGILGWGFYALGITWALEARAAGGLLGRLRLPIGASPLVALAATHALLVAAWWGCFRWAQVELPREVVYVVALGAIASSMALLARPARRMSLAVATPRVLAASVFVVLLVERSAATGALGAFHWLHLAALAMFYTTAVRWSDSR